ncbi:MAG: zinc ribbon domain-containing protein [Thermoplasmata archaeon]
MTHKSGLSDSVWTAFTEAIRFVVVPLALIELVTSNYPLLTTPFMPYIREYILFFGAMVVAASTLEAMNRPGTFKRLLFGLSALAFVGLWLAVLFGGGIAEFTYGPYHFRLDLTKLVYIMLVGISLKALLVVDTYLVHQPQLAEEAAKKRMEEAEARRVAARTRKAAHQVKHTIPLEHMTKVAYEVTPDTSVGYSPPPAPEKVSSPTPPPSQTAVRHRTCPICGERVRSTESVCPNCGAWLTRDSFRFSKRP